MADAPGPAGEVEGGEAPQTQDANLNAEQAAVGRGCTCPPKKGKKKTGGSKKKTGGSKKKAGGSKKKTGGKKKGGSASSKKKAKAGKGALGLFKKTGTGNHTANCFILFFLDTWGKGGGNIFEMAKECGRRWWNLPQSVKDKYRKQYCAKNKNSRVCRRGTGGGGGGRGKPKPRPTKPPKDRNTKPSPKPKPGGGC